MRSTACWSSGARSLSASPDPERGWGKCARTPDPCNTPPCADPDAGNLEAQVPQPDQPLDAQSVQPIWSPTSAPAQTAIKLATPSRAMYRLSASFPPEDRGKSVHVLLVVIHVRADA
jgi:hypothetical protein